MSYQKQLLSHYVYYSCHTLQLNCTGVLHGNTYNVASSQFLKKSEAAEYIWGELNKPVLVQKSANTQRWTRSIQASWT